MKDLPEKVFKYRVWRNGSHKNLLLNNELYLASPKDFNDPFDCRIPPNFIDISDKEKDDYIKELAIKHFKETEQRELNLEEVIKDLEKRLNDSARFQKEAEKLTYEKQDKYYGVLALSCRWNSILMWSHYSDCHTGFCVGFWEEKLRNTGFFGKAGVINYDVKFPDLKPMVSKKPEDLIQRTFIQIYTKSEDWAKEEEYRLVKNFFPDEPKPFERIIHVSDEVLAEVILGINISDNDSEEIIEICNKKNIPVYRAKKKDFMFEINRELII